jgi:hypothetical protein
MPAPAIGRKTPAPSCWRILPLPATFGSAGPEVKSLKPHWRLRRALFQSTGKAKSVLSGELGKHRGRYDYWRNLYHRTNNAPDQTFGVNNRAFLLKFARNRDAYRAKAREHLRQMKRDPCWTESLAVGSLGIVLKVKLLVLSRREIEIVPTDDNVWVLQEAVIAYGQETNLKNASKPIK